MLANDYSKDIFTKSIKYSKGVGPKYAEILAKKGIITLYDLIAFFPRAYDDRRKTLKLHEALENKDKTSVVYVEVIDVSSFTFQYRSKPLVIVTDGIAVCEVPIYGGRLPAGVLCDGHIFDPGGDLQMVHRRREYVQHICQLYVIDEYPGRPVLRYDVRDKSDECLQRLYRSDIRTRKSFCRCDCRDQYVVSIQGMYGADICS